MSFPSFLAPRYIRLPRGFGEPLSKFQAPSGGGGIGGGQPYKHKELKGFSVPPQMATKWCWAAVTVGVAAYGHGGYLPKQCQIATETLVTLGALQPGDSCCRGNTSCDVAVEIDTPLDLTGVLRGTVVNSLPVDGVVSEIDGNLPVVCYIRYGVKWSGTDYFVIGHFVAIAGYSEPIATGSDRRNADEILLHVHDPADGSKRIVSYTKLLKSYNGAGDWICTYLIAYINRSAMLANWPLNRA